MMEEAMSWRIDARVMIFLHGFMHMHE